MAGAERPSLWAKLFIWTYKNSCITRESRTILQWRGDRLQTAGVWDPDGNWEHSEGEKDYQAPPKEQGLV